MNRRVAVTLVVGAGLMVSAAVVYVFRAHLRGVPVIGEWVAGAPPAAQIWVCPMHPEVRRPAPGTCPKCGMDLVPEPPAGHEHPGRSAAGSGAVAPADRSGAAPRARLSLDLRRQQLIGVRLAEVRQTPIARTLRAVGLVQYDETRQVDVNLKVEGWIRELYVDYTGQPITRGQPLFTLYSPDLVATQNEYLLALETRDRLRQSQVADARSYADRLADAARQRLALWDLAPDQIETIERTRQAQHAVVFHSPASGYVIEKRAVKGMRIMPGESLYRIADLSVVWVEAEVYESELPFATPGAHARVSFDAYPGETFVGRVSYIYPYVAETSRTVRVRLELANPSGRLKPGMYANIEIDSTLGLGLTVPADAVVDSGRAQFVFVALGDGYFEPRRIRVGQRLPDAIQIVDGLSAGERVAGAATFFIDSESQLRAAMQGFEEAPSIEASASGGASAPSLEVAFATKPDPPRVGDNSFEVRLRDERGAPIVDAEVALRLYMAPMPSMNMPAMRVEVRLLAVGDGLYRGQGNVSMAGRWEVTVSATRGGRRLAQRQLAIVAQ